MSFWLQHGQGKGDRITDLAELDAVDGVILSPAHESRPALVETIRGIGRFGLMVMLDPQTYVYSIAGASAQRHPDNGLEFEHIHWSVDPGTIERHVGAVLAANDALGIRQPMIAPSVLQRGFQDAWAVTAFQYARASARVAEGREVLASLVIEDGALGDWRPIEEWLDVATTLPVAGFYVVVARDARTYPMAWEAQRVANLMRLTYRLTELNGYRVLLGYADFDGLGIMAAGASGLASGWHYSLRVFRTERWIPGGFGRPPIARVTSSPLLTPIAVRGEAEYLAGSALGPSILTDARVRAAVAAHPEAWTSQAAQVQHLLELSTVARGMEGLPLEDRLQSIEDRVHNAIALLESTRQTGVQLNPAYRPRLRAMASAIALFRAAEAV